MKRPLALLACLVSLLLVAPVALSGACDKENTCPSICPTGQRFSNDGTCACMPFDAGFCAFGRDCPDAYCPASEVPDACGGGQLWSTTICACYSFPGLPDARADAGVDAADIPDGPHAGG